MGFLKNTLKGALVAKVASEARKPQNQARAKSALAGLRRRVSGQGSPTPVRDPRTTGTTTGTAAGTDARKGTASPR